MFDNKNAALQWRLKRRNELLQKLDKTLREINIIEKEIKLFHNEDNDSIAISPKNIHEKEIITQEDS